MNGNACTLLIRNTAGEEEVGKPRQDWVEKADGIVFVYDVSRRSSFEHREQKLSYIERNCKGHIPLSVILIGNMAD